MTPVYWTPEAKSRLRSIRQYIEQDSPMAAKAVAQRILERSHQLEVAPLSGRKVPECQRNDVRELAERPYRIIYRAAGDRVVILTIMHYRQLLPSDILPA